MNMRGTNLKLRSYSNNSYILVNNSTSDMPVKESQFLSITTRYQTWKILSRVVGKICMTCLGLGLRTSSHRDI